MRYTCALAGTLMLALSAAPGTFARDFSSHDAEVEALLSKMTLDEKIGQMVQADSGALVNKADVQNYYLGSVLSGGGTVPDGGNTKENWLHFANTFESYALKTRLQIPIIYGIDAVHGNNNVDGAVIFPHHIGLGATRDPKLIERAERVVADEVAATGIRWAFAPCVAVAEDEHWGRTYESYGQSTELVSALGVASVHGFQGKTLSSDPTSVLACAKHFLGDGGTQNGTDRGNVVCDEATLRKLYLPPYRAAIKAGVGSIMISYSSWNGQRMHGNQHLLTGVLKNELGFRGFLVSDWAGIDLMSPDFKRDVRDSVNAGLDMIMIPNGPGKPNNYVEFINDLKDLVAHGQVAEARIDDAVRRILRIKYQMGLFENPVTDPGLLGSIGSPKHREVARECVRESAVLLKNDHRTLPLSKNLNHLVVVGAAANDLGIQCGGWTISWQGSTGAVTHAGTTLLAGIRQAVDSHTEVTFSPDASNLAGADAVVVAIGEIPYAEMNGDRTDLRITPVDAALIEKAHSTGAPVVTVLFSGRPLILGSSLKHSDAFVAAWLPGTEGEGLADVLFGDCKPIGKLPRPWPTDNVHASTVADTADMPALFPFGFGLTYTSGLAGGGRSVAARQQLAPE